MPDTPLHPLDAATRVTAAGDRWRGSTSDDYWAFVGPFGGATAATVLRALIEHPLRAGDPLSLTVNFCAPIARGAFDLTLRLAKANRSSQHWFVELTQEGGEAATIATAVFAERRPTWSHQPAERPSAPPFEQIASHEMGKARWVGQYDFRFVEGKPQWQTGSDGPPGDAFSKFWISDRLPRKIDMVSLMAMSDAFFARIFHAKGAFVPVGTVTLTTYFHASAAEIAEENTDRVLAQADAKIFHRSYGDQTGELWSPSGRLLATTHQIAYFKA